MVVVFHELYWKYFNQSRVSFSYIGAEIFAAGTSADINSLLTEFLPLYTAPKLPYLLLVDSDIFYPMITTLFKVHDYELPHTVALIWD